MKKGEALPGKYLSKDDFQQPTLVTIRTVVMELIKSDRGKDEEKPVLYVDNPSNDELDIARGIVLNVGNWDACEEITGQPDSDDWKGSDIVIYVDPNVMFGGKKTGGIRIRAPKTAPAEVEEPPPPMPPDDVPF